MRLYRTVWVVLPLFALACNNSSSSGDQVPSAMPSASTTTQSAPVTPPSAMTSAEKPHMDHHGPGGFVGMFLRQARELTTLKDDQKTALDKLEQPLTTDDASPKTEMKDFHTDLIAQIRAGKIDTTKLKTHYDAIDKAGAARQAAEGDVLNGLHSDLDATQRKALVASIRAKQAEREEKWKSAAKDMNPADWGKHRLEHMTKELTLDDGQQKSVQALLDKDKPTQDKMDAMKADTKKKSDAVLTAFEGDTFDAKKIDFNMQPGKTPHEGLDKEVTFLTALLPILKPDQREKLAAGMEKPHMPHMGGGMGMMGPQTPMMDEDEMPTTTTAPPTGTAPATGNKGGGTDMK